MLNRYTKIKLVKKDLKMEEIKISCLRAKVDLSDVNQSKGITEVCQGKELLFAVDLNIMGEKEVSIRDSGAEISAFRKKSDKFLTGQILDKLLTGDHIYMIPALGETQKADLIILPSALWDENHSFSTEIDVIAAVIENLNFLPLTAPSVYETQKKAKLNSVSTEVLNVEIQVTGWERDRLEFDKNI